jgi:hypothetical protein
MENTQNAKPNLANFYILPLLGLNKFSFGESNFINSFVTTNEEVVVEVEDFDKVPQEFIKNVNYMTDLELDGRNFIFYQLPDEIRDTILKFVAGKYSTFSDKAKTLIRKHSGLPYNVKLKGADELYTAELLMVLDKSPVLKARLEKTLDVKIPNDAELRDKPSSANIINF